MRNIEGITDIAGFIVLSSAIICLTAAIVALRPMSVYAHPTLFGNEKERCARPASEFSSEKYWYAKTIDVHGLDLKDIGESYTGRLIVSNACPVKFFITKEAYKDRAGKEKGFKKALEAIVKLAGNDWTIPKLKSITDQTFDDPAQWAKWYGANKDSLMLSEDGERLVVK